METEKQRIEELVKQLNAASAAYYNGQDEIMPNYEWDALFDELTTLEEKTGYIIKDSPTQNAGYEESGSGQKEPHEYPALSLAKTKQVEELQQWAGAYPIWLSWKLDGLTLVLTYDNGNLVKILTRGNGNLTCRAFTSAGSSRFSVPDARFRGFAYFSSSSSIMSLICAKSV